MDQVQNAVDASLETWERVMRVNATGTFLMTGAVLPHMIARKSGSIVNTASAAGTRGGASGVAYTASKHAVVGITRSVATMHKADGIRCNAVSPGMTATNIAASAGGPFDAAGWATLREPQASIGRTSDPSEVAATIIFLASDAASYVNGAILPADGGWTAG
jgi:NAD(P)-dependent dehydrogenase (short-subunit alcohol dehydrogenase family)